MTYALKTVAALYATGLQSAFSIERIHDVLTQSRCTICNRHGGYVFLLGLQRCCQRCAVYDPELMPIDLELAKREYDLIDEAAIASIPKKQYSRHDTCHESASPNGNYEVLRIPSYDLSDGGTSATVPAPAGIRYIVSRAEAQKVGSVAPQLNTATDGEPTHKRFAGELTLSPMPCLDSKTQKVILGYRCKGCSFVSGHNSYCNCQLSLPGGVDVAPDWNWPATHESGGEYSCAAGIARGRLYTAEEILAHFTECTSTQELLADYALELQRPPPSETKTTKRKGRKRARY